MSINEILPYLVAVIVPIITGLIAYYSSRKKSKDEIQALEDKHKMQLEVIEKEFQQKIELMDKEKSNTLESKLTDMLISELKKSPKVKNLINDTVEKNIK